MASKTRFIALTLLVLLLSGSFLKLYCAVPRLIGFQGRLTNPSGQAVTGSKDIVFKIYDLVTDGTVLWQETQTVALDASGFYNVYLGEVTALNLDFNNPCWLSVTIGSETLSPRYRLVPTAYSFYSLKASSAAFAQSVNWADVKNKPTGLDNGVGASTIGSYQIIDGTITVNDLASNIDASAKGFNADKVDGLHASSFLLKSSGTMSGNLDMGSNSITNVYSIKASTIGATGQTVYYGYGGNLTGLVGGGNMVQATYDANSNNIVDNSEALNNHPDTYFASKSYVDSSVGSGGMLSSANAFTGYNTFSKMVTISTAATVTGSFRAKDITLSNFTTRYYSIPGSEVAGTVWVGNDPAFSSFGITVADDVRTGVVPLHLPHGAKIINISFKSYINSGPTTASLEAKLIRVDNTPSANVEATLPTNITISSPQLESLVTNIIVDNKNNAYKLVFSATANAAMSTILLFNTTITYTITSPLP